MDDGESKKLKKTLKKEVEDSQKFVPLNKKINRSLLNDIAHEVFTGFNCTEDHTLANVQSSPACNISYPRPIYISDSLPNLIDPCHQRSRAHWNYFSTLRRYQSHFKLHKRKKGYKNAVRKGIYPSIVVRFAELLELNPDPYFSGRYDWYYTGGNLDLVDDRNILIHVTGNGVDTLVVSDILNDTTQQILTPRVMKMNELENDREIFEIQTIASSPSVAFSVRRKHEISIYTYDDGNVERNYSFTQADVPYISSASDPQQRNAFVTSDLEKVVALWDVKNSTTKPIRVLHKSKAESDEKDQNWNCIRYYDRDTYAFTDLHEFTLLDARDPCAQSAHKLGSFGDGYEFCERISGMCTSEYKNLLYIGTSHKIFAVDMRFIGREVDDKHIVIRWTHQMNMSPLILRAHRQDNYELVTSTSPISGDVRYYENIVDRDCKHTSPCLPFMPPSLLDAYNNARIRGNCLDPTARLKDRIAACITGMNFFKQNGNLFTLTSNSNGDVFSQKIAFGEFKPPTEEENAIVMDRWEKDSIEVSKSANIQLNVTKVDDMSGMSKVFRCARLDKKREQTVDEPERPFRRYRWQRSIEDLNGYKDALVPDLLAIWDFDLDEKKALDLETTVEEKKGKSLVEEWLNDTPAVDNKPPTPMVSINDTSFLTSTQNTQFLQNLCTTTADFDVEDETQAIIHSKPKTKANVSRRSTYVKGF